MMYICNVISGVCEKGINTSADKASRFFFFGKKNLLCICDTDQGLSAFFIGKVGWGGRRVFI